MATENSGSKARTSAQQPEKTSATGLSIPDDIFSRGASEEQLKALRAAAEAHKAAQMAVMEAAGVLWNSQVDAAITIGGSHGGTIAMSRRLNFFDNCTCSPCPIVIGCW